MPYFQEKPDLTEALRLTKENAQMLVRWVRDYSCLAEYFQSFSQSGLVIPEFRKDNVIHTDSYDIIITPKPDQEEEESLFNKLERLVLYGRWIVNKVGELGRGTADQKSSIECKQKNLSHPSAQ